VSVTPDELLDQLEELEKEWVRRYEEEYFGWEYEES